MLTQHTITVGNGYYKQSEGDFQTVYRKKRGQNRTNGTNDHSNANESKKLYEKIAEIEKQEAKENVIITTNRNFPVSCALMIFSFSNYLIIPLI